MNGRCNLSHQAFRPSRRAKSRSTADTAAGGPLDGVTVTILNADKRIVFTGTLSMSWALTVLLRKVPLLARMI